MGGAGQNKFKSSVAGALHLPAQKVPNWNIRRVRLGMKKMRLRETMDPSFQQIRKYESGPTGFPLTDCSKSAKFPGVNVNDFSSSPELSSSPCSSCVDKSPREHLKTLEVNSTT